MSTTAFHVQQGILYIARHTMHKEVVPGSMSIAAESILSATPQGKKYLKQIEDFWFRQRLRLMQALLLPEISLHYVLRKRFIEDQVRAAIANNVRQIINLGAGLDTLLWRLDAEQISPNVTYYEIDQSEVMGLKRHAVDSSETHIMIEADLTSTTPAELLKAQPRFDPTLPAMIVMEGFLMYLKKDTVLELLEGLATLTTGGTRLVFTAVDPPGSPFFPDNKLLKAYLALQKEPLAWSINRSDVAELCAQAGCQVSRIADSEYLSQTYLAKNQGIRHSQPESIFLAQYPESHP